MAMNNTQGIIDSRSHFVESIQHLEWIETIYPSSTNFVLIKTKPEVDLFNYLKAQGVVTRNQAHEPALTHCVRITIGSPSSMQEVAEIINQYPYSAL
jgi:histidinol-phosphate aminotransferase